MKVHRERLLAAVVDSEAGRHAGREAVRLAASLGGRLTIVSVVPSYGGNMDLLHVRNAKQALIQPHQKVLAEIEQKAKTAKVAVRTILEEGEPFERIVDVAESEAADVVILARDHGALAERMALGSTAARVIGYTQADVMVVPAGAPIDFSGLLLTVDGSPHGASAASRAINLAQAYGGLIRALTVIDVPSEYYLYEPVIQDLVDQAGAGLERIKKQAEETGVSLETLIKHGDAPQVIVDTAREQAATLIIMGSHGRLGLRRLLLGSVVERVLPRSPCPVLVVH
ncbi:MAG: universal stress protein [Thermodesulfobacteriota bacterium]